MEKRERECVGPSAELACQILSSNLSFMPGKCHISFSVSFWTENGGGGLIGNGGQRSGGAFVFYKAQVSL